MKNFKVYLSMEGQKKVSEGQLPEELKKVLAVTGMQGQQKK
ncbi:hypothetical protein [Sutcliffiella horikoshii]|nr:hypothetical protein [Sutcliffiella horikoshii]